MKKTPEEDKELDEKVQEWIAIYENTIRNIDNDPELEQQARDFFGQTYTPNAE